MAAAVNDESLFMSPKFALDQAYDGFVSEKGYAKRNFIKIGGGICVRGREIAGDDLINIQRSTGMVLIPTFEFYKVKIRRLADLTYKILNINS